jgi:serine/threonine protein kinase
MAEKEIKLMNKLNHPNIIKCYDQFRFQGNWYIVLEYCGKGDLEKYKKKVGKCFVTKVKYPSITAKCS